MLIAIHAQAGPFSTRWIERCSASGIAHRIVDCRSTTIIGELAGVDGLLWNWQHSSPEDQLVARQLLTAVEHVGIKVFPNALTSWHYDDKIAQKYLLEAVGAPIIPTYLFLNETDATTWIRAADFPKVFKLRSGAGSSNVQLVEDRADAYRLCRLMFGEGTGAESGGYFADFRRKVRNTRGPAEFLGKLLRMRDSLHSIERRRQFLPLQRGYIYFQDYLGGNGFDTRITVIGSRAFAFLRMNRPGDFRASGSGSLVYGAERVNVDCVRVAFEVSRQLRADCLAMDFLMDSNSRPRIAEVSYSFAPSAVHGCLGHWDEELNWHAGHLHPEDCVLDDFVAQLVDPKSRQR